ncbi:SAE2-domain-containing protein [Apiospora aurea]|uniref:SAE2-domain-containing protein n=1 Tax=Apiospora aurea TaxID=335848 RepID=A0ABR1QCF5_9PEZI
MENWFEDAGKPALLQAFTQVCSRIEKDFKDSVEAENHKKAELDAELQTLRVRAANVDRLEQQNKALKGELAQLKRSLQQDRSDAAGQENTSPNKSRFSRPPSGNARVPLTPVSVNVRKSILNEHADFTGLSLHEQATDYGILEGKYKRLRSQTADLVQANEKLQSELRERTKTTHSWKEYATKQKECAERRKGLIKRLKEELAVATNNVALDSSFTSHTNPNSPDPHVPDVAEAPDALRTRYSPSTEPPVQRNTTDLLQFGKSPIGLNGRIETDNHGGGQAVEEPGLPPMPDTRGCKRPDAPIKNEPSSDTPVVVSEHPVRKGRHKDKPANHGSAVTRVKTEEGSDPAVMDDQRHFVPHESIDFDDVENLLSTPRRSRNARQAETAATLASVYTPEDNLQDITELPHDLTSDASSPATNHVSMSAHVQRLAGPLSDIPVISAPDDGNTTLLGGIASLAEDGDDNRDDTTERPGPTFLSTGRLDSLLKTASPEKQAIRPSRGTPPEKPRPIGFSIPSTSTRTTPLGNEGRNTVDRVAVPSETPSSKNLKRTFTAIQPTQKAPGTGARSKRHRKDSLRLRDRPQWSLRLEDFKINPKHNDGLEYAFSEVVRNKEDRLCLPGCVREECCAPGYRSQARGQRLETGAIAFQSLLENWLGDEAWRLASMNEDEKEALWLKAKTQQNANEFGKGHRYRVPRASTPPGYFNVDFPSTQQLDKDNQLTAVMQRERVEERYREAMKPNQTGRWLFRDE